MKKLTALLMALMCVLTMTACGKTGAETETFTPDTLASVEKAGAFSEELEELDADTAFMLYRLADYGLERSDLTGCAVLRSAGATCEEGAVLILSDAAKADKAAEALGAYLEGQIESNADYRPAEIPKLEGAVLMTRGNTVLLAVANDAAAVRSVFE